MTDFPAPCARRPASRTLGRKQRADDEIGAVRQRLLRRRRGAVRRRAIVLDDQGQIIAAGLGQSQFGRVAHRNADGARAARGLRQRQDEADLDRTRADLVGRRGRRRVGFLRRGDLVGGHMAERAAGGSAARQRKRERQDGERRSQV